MADNPENSDIGPGDDISQDDIDALTNAAGGDAPASPDDSGPVSQDDVDALLSGGADASAPAEDESGSVDQSAIDDLFGDSPAASPAAPESSTDDAGLGDGLLSQADIDAALAGGGADMPASAEPDVPSAAEPDEARLDSAGRPFDAVAAEMAAAIAEEKAAAELTASAAPVGEPLELPSFGDDLLIEGLNNEIDLLHDVDLRVKIELGRTRMLVEDVLRLGSGSVVELDKLAGDPVDVYANDRLIARGEVLVLNDNFCVRVSEIVSGDQDALVGA